MKRFIDVIIADDSDAFRQILTEIVTMNSQCRVVGTAKDGHALLELLECVNPDIALIDIDMPKLTGMEVVEIIRQKRPRLQVIFITGSEEHAVRAFSVEAVDYLVKPVDKSRLLLALQKAIVRIYGHDLPDNSKKAYLHKVVVRGDKSTYYLEPQDIIFIERIGRKSHVHMRDKVIDINESIGELIAVLPDNFYQTHRSYIVNTDYLYKITKTGDTYVGCLKCTEQKVYISKNKIQGIQRL